MNAPTTLDHIAGRLEASGWTLTSDHLWELDNEFSLSIEHDGQGNITEMVMGYVDDEASSVEAWWVDAEDWEASPIPQVMDRSWVVEILELT